MLCKVLVKISSNDIDSRCHYYGHIDIILSRRNSNSTNSYSNRNSTYSSNSNSYSNGLEK